VEQHGATYGKQMRLYSLLRPRARAGAGSNLRVRVKELLWAAMWTFWFSRLVRRRNLGPDCASLFGLFVWPSEVDLKMLVKLCPNSLERIAICERVSVVHPTEANLCIPAAGRRAEV